MIDLRGKRILFTGRLRSFRRLQAQQLATILGAKPVNGIDKKVDILVVGIISKPYDQLLTTQKLTYASTYGIPKIDELAFISWCQWRLDHLYVTTVMIKTRSRSFKCEFFIPNFFDISLVLSPAKRRDNCDSIMITRQTDVSHPSLI